MLMKSPIAGLLKHTGILLLTVFVWGATTATAPAQAQPQAPLISGGAGSNASSILGTATNQTPFVPTPYKNVEVRHTPGPPPPAALMQAAREGRRTPITEIDGTSSKGGKLMRVDESYLIPETAPALASTNAATAVQKNTNQQIQGSKSR